MNDDAKWSEALRKFVKKLLESDSDTPINYEDRGEPGFENFVFTEPAASWDEFLRWVNALEGRWCFRGQREAAWSLTTSLDRAVWRHKSTEHSSSTYHLDRAKAEADLLFRFLQQAPQYLTHLPRPGDWGSWLAMMQHYGAPTRLLDWTTSPYVGMYFAVEEEPVREEKCSALWAISLDWLDSKAEELLRSMARLALPSDPNMRAWAVNDLLAPTQSKHGSILAVNPLIGNERLAAQQGILLCKLFPEAFFYQVLMTMMIKPQLTDRQLLEN